MGSTRGGKVGFLRNAGGEKDPAGRQYRFCLEEICGYSRSMKDIATGRIRCREVEEKEYSSDLEVGESYEDEIRQGGYRRARSSNHLDE